MGDIVSLFIDENKDSNGFIVAHEFNDDARRLSQAFGYLPIVDFYDNSQFDFDKDSIFMFIFRDNHFGINFNIYNSLGLEMGEIIKRRVSGLIMYMIPITRMKKGRS
jgi:hypothetical protein